MKLYKKQKFLTSRLQRPVAARNDVIAKIIASGLFQNLSGRPEDWLLAARAISIMYTSYSPFEAFHWLCVYMVVKLHAH